MRRVGRVPHAFRNNCAVILHGSSYLVCGRGTKLVIRRLRLGTTDESVRISDSITIEMGVLCSVYYIACAFNDHIVLLATMSGARSFLMDPCLDGKWDDDMRKENIHVAELQVDLSDCRCFFSPCHCLWQYDPTSCAYFRDSSPEIFRILINTAENTAILSRLELPFSHDVYGFCCLQPLPDGHALLIGGAGSDNGLLDTILDIDLAALTVQKIASLPSRRRCESSIVLFGRFVFVFSLWGEGETGATGALAVFDILTKRVSNVEHPLPHTPCLSDAQLAHTDRSLYIISCLSKGQCLAITFRELSDCITDLELREAFRSVIPPIHIPLSAHTTPPLKAYRGYVDPPVEERLPERMLRRVWRPPVFFPVSTEQSPAEDPVEATAP